MKWTNLFGSLFKQSIKLNQFFLSLIRLILYVQKKLFTLQISVRLPPEIQWHVQSHYIFGAKTHTDTIHFEIFDESTFTHNVICLIEQLTHISNGNKVHQQLSQCDMKPNKLVVNCWIKRKKRAQTKIEYLTVKFGIKSLNLWSFRTNKVGTQVSNTELQHGKIEDSPYVTMYGKKFIVGYKYVTQLFVFIVSVCARLHSCVFACKLRILKMENIENGYESTHAHGLLKPHWKQPH